MKVLHTDKAPAAVGPYSQAIEVNGFVFCSGQLPIDPATGVFAEAWRKGTDSPINSQCSRSTSFGRIRVI